MSAQMNINLYCKFSALGRLEMELMVTSQNSGAPMRKKGRSQKTQPSLGLEPEIKTWFILGEFKCYHHLTNPAHKYSRLTYFHPTIRKGKHLFM